MGIDFITAGIPGVNLYNGTAPRLRFGSWEHVSLTIGPLTTLPRFGHWPLSLLHQEIAELVT